LNEHAPMLIKALEGRWRAFGGVAVLVLFLAQGCSLQTIALRTTVDIFDTASLAVEEETDLELARPAVFSTAKILEGFLKGDPGNVTLTTLVVKSFFSLSFAYIEDEFEEYQFKDPVRAKVAKLRASGIYKRAYRYGLELIQERCSAKKDLELGNLEEFGHCIDRIGDNIVELAFWTGFAWGKFLFLNLDDPRAIGQMPKLMRIMEKVETKNPEIYFGSLYTFYGVLYGSRSKMLGGDPEKSLNFFQKASDLNKKSNLMVHLFKAQFYAKQTMNQELFNEELRYVIDFKGEYEPRLGLLNAISRKKAERLLAQTDDIF
jgi:hypothetical protein